MLAPFLLLTTGLLLESVVFVFLRLDTTSHDERSRIVVSLRQLIIPVIIIKYRHCGYCSGYFNTEDSTKKGKFADEIYSQCQLVNYQHYNVVRKRATCID